MKTVKTDFETLLQTVLNVLCEYPERAMVDIHSSTQTSFLISIKVDSSDYGKVIGHGGEIAKALRTIIRAYAGKHRVKFLFEIGALP